MHAETGRKIARKNMPSDPHYVEAVLEIQMRERNPARTSEDEMDVLIITVSAPEIDPHYVGGVVPMTGELFKTVSYGGLILDRRFDQMTPFRNEFAQLPLIRPLSEIVVPKRTNVVPEKIGLIQRAFKPNPCPKISRSRVIILVSGG